MTAVIRSFLRRAAPLALSALLLAGCITSKRPLFAETSAVALFGEGGRYATYQPGPGGWQPDEPMVLRHRGRAYEFVDGKGTITPVTFHPIANERYAAQFRMGGGDYGYVMVRMRGKTAFISAADCDRQDLRKLAALGVEVHERECRLDKVSDVPALFAALRFNKRTGKMTPALPGVPQRR